jgi:hypothetical protein
MGEHVLGGVFDKFGGLGDLGSSIRETSCSCVIAEA